MSYDMEGGCRAVRILIKLLGCIWLECAQRLLKYEILQILIILTELLNPGSFQNLLLISKNSMRQSVAQIPRVLIFPLGPCIKEPHIRYLRQESDACGSEPKHISSIISDQLSR